MKLLYVLAFVLLLAIPIVFAEDSYKPYLHKPQVPEAPKVRLFGAYQTDLFPGAATYSYPIDLPPGTHGLQPSLSLMYSSQGAKGRPGILGSGWEFTHDYIIKNLNGTITDASDDFYTLFLNGRNEKLVVNGSQLKTEIEFGARIDAHLGANTTVGTYWVVTTKDGTQYRFGYTSDSEINSGVSTVWNLDQVTDTYGNTVAYFYDNDPNVEDINAHYLSRIEYNRDKKRVVKLWYETSVRPDRRRVVREGSFLEQSRRLNSIEIFADDAFVRRYAFTYTNVSISTTALATIKQYGNDNASLLHTVTFTYGAPVQGYVNQTSLWLGPTIFASSASVDFGVRPLDVNNDGFVDFLKARASTSERSTFLSNKTGNWTNSTQFIPPVDFVYGVNDLDNGVRFADIDADERLDILQSSTVAGKNVFINNDTSWINRTSAWTIPIYFVSSDIDQGIELVDVNGDGKTDIIQATNGTQNVYLNTGSGWLASASWVFPTILMNGSSDSGARVVDVNGDGFPDVVRSAPEQQQTWLNNGSSWIATSSWAPPVHFKNASGDFGVRFADANGDGLIDLLRGIKDGSGTNLSAWLNNGTGWVLDASWAPPESFVADGLNTGRRLADVDGDGLADFMVTIGNSSSQNGNTYTKKNNNGLLLKSITNEYGGLVSINYTSSTQFDNTGGDGISDLGFAVNVVDFVDKNNSMSGTFNIFATTAYNYSGGLYDAADVQFRGFANVTETLPDLTVVKHYFLQDDSRKGKEWKTETYNQRLLSVGLMNYSSLFLNPNYRVLLESSETQQFDGNDVAFKTRTVYAFDQYLNIIEKDALGDVSDTQDDRIEKYAYEYSVTNHIVDKPIKYQLFGVDNMTKVKESTFSYDDGIITKGGLTRKEDWNDRGDNIVTRFTYDGYGNRVSSMDSLGHVTTYEYGLRDSTFTFLDRMTNALGHAEEYSYDLGTGNLLSQTKNEITTSYVYDVFGRITKEIRPYDSDVLPTKQYNYTFNGFAPETVSLSLRETANAKNKALQYNYDGFANVVQIRSEADDNQYVVKNLYYDGLGRVFKEDNPYFGTSTTFAEPLNGTAFTNYSYDGLGRVHFVKNPDGTNKTINFNKTIITDYDENGHRHAYHLDGFGQIVKVQEFNNDPVLNLQLEPYNTTYEYDDQGNLVLITDTEGNEFKFTYDSLGRKVQLDDPDLGRWTYAYDAVGNLVRQTDNRGKITELSYDTLNRVSRKNATTGVITFGYDGQFEGTLTNITSVNGTVKRYTYDDRMRITKEEVLMRGGWRTTGFTYDSMDRIVEQELPAEILEYYYSKQGKMQKIPGYIDYATYNAFGSLLDRNYTTGRVLSFTYNDTNNRLVRMFNGLAQDIRYQFDSVGNVLQINDTVNNRAHVLGYDNLDRLTSAILSGETYKYEYDALGRIVKTQENNLVRRYNYLGAQAHAPSDIVTRAPDAEVRNAQDLDTDSKSRVYEFYLVNETGTASNQNWSLKVAGSTITSSQINLSAPIMVLVEYNHSSGGTYAVNVTTKNDTSVFDSEFGLAAEGVEALAQNGSRSISEFVITNDVSQSITGVNWSCGTISASQTASISGNSQLMVLVEQNYSTSGILSLNCSAKSNDGNDSETATFNLQGLSVEELNTISQNINTKVVSFNLFNYHDAQSLTFNTTTSESTIRNSSTLATNAMIMVFEEVNYSQDGQKNITVSVGSALLNESGRETLLLEALKIKYDRYDDNTSTQIAYFDVDNDWISNLTINFTASSPSINNVSNVSSNKTVMVFVEEAYSPGKKTPLFTALTQNFTATLRDIFTIVPIDLLNYQILKQNRSSTIAEFDIRNNDNATNVSWSMLTGQATLLSNVTVSLNKTKEIFVFVETNYTSTGVYATTGIANSTSSADNSTGVAVI